MITTYLKTGVWLRKAVLAALDGLLVLFSIGLGVLLRYGSDIGAMRIVLMPDRLFLIMSLYP